MAADAVYRFAAFPRRAAHWPVSSNNSRLTGQSLSRMAQRQMNHHSWFDRISAARPHSVLLSPSNIFSHVDREITRRRLHNVFARTSGRQRVPETPHYGHSYRKDLHQKVASASLVRQSEAGETASGPEEPVLESPVICTGVYST